MTYDEIIEEIKDGLTGDAKADIQYLKEQSDKYKDHELSQEILRACGRMMASCLPEEAREEFNKLVNIVLNDEAYKVVVNAKGSRDNLSDEMIDFLDFLQGKENDGKLSKELDSAVKEAIKDGLWKEEYNMTWQMKIDEEREDVAISAMIEAFFECNISEDDITKKLMSKFLLTEQEAIECITEYKESVFQLV